MKRTPACLSAGAFTLIELLCVIAIIGILAAMLLPVLSQGQDRAKLVWCGNNLAQTGLGFQSFAHEHNSEFPLQVAAADGGVMDTTPLTDGLDFSGHSFQAMGGDLGSPRILVCPTDTRTPAGTFATLQSSNVSYFASASGSYNAPESIVAGDRNLALPAGGTTPNSTFPFVWTATQHRLRGNLLYADGHVAALQNFQLAQASFPLTTVQTGNNPSTPPIQPLSPPQLALLSAILSQAAPGYPAAAFRPVLAQRWGGQPDPADNHPPGDATPDNADQTASGNAAPAPTPAPDLNAPADNAPVTRPTVRTNPPVLMANPDDAGITIIDGRKSAASSIYLATGSWLLRLVAAVILAWRIWARTQRKTPPRPSARPAA